MIRIYENIHGVDIRINDDNFISLSDLKKAYNIARINNGRERKNIDRILTNMSFRSWFEGTFCQLTPEYIGASFLKENGFKVTTGARNSKSVWVHKQIYEYAKDRLFSRRASAPSFSFENRYIELIRSLFIGITPFYTQYKVLDYRVDVYFEELNVCVEFDEPHHLSKDNRGSDAHREYRIKEALNCEFIRLRIGEELLSIRKIIELMKLRNENKLEQSKKELSMPQSNLLG